MRFVLLPLLGILAAANTAPGAETVTFTSGPAQTILLELFTSEGCSSCPPAEEWISTLRSSPDLWRHVVPLSFHVNYWDQLGWKDRFASAAFTERQQRYAKAWRADSVYTPAFVLNGREWRDRAQPQDWAKLSTAKVGTLTVTWKKTGADIAFSPASPMHEPLRSEVALLGGHVESEVLRGENRGRKLRHDFTVLHLASAPLRAEGDRHLGAVGFTANEVKDAAAIAAWIHDDKETAVLQATGGWLVKP